MADGGDGFGNPLNALSGILNLFGSADQGFKTLIANLMNEQRYAEGKGLLEGMRTGDSATIQRALEGRVGEENEAMARAAAGLRASGDRYTTGLAQNRDAILSYLQGAGEQERKDIRQQYSSMGAGQQADLVSRGLSGTTIAPTMRAGNLRNETADIGRLEERLRGQKMNWTNLLNQGVTEAQARVGDRNTQFELQRAMGAAGGRYDIEAIPMSMRQDFTRQLVNWIGAREDVAPSENAFLATQGQLGRGRAAAAPEPETSWLPFATGGATGAVAATVPWLL